MPYFCNKSEWRRGGLYPERIKIRGSLPNTLGAYVGEVIFNFFIILFLFLGIVFFLVLVNCLLVLVNNYLDLLAL
jgi:hypothetical protein